MRGRREGPGRRSDGLIVGGAGVLYLAWRVGATPPDTTLFAKHAPSPAAKIV